MYQLGLFLHFASLLLAFFATGRLFAGMNHVRQAQTLAGARSALENIASAAKMFPVSILGLFITGAYMTQTRWGWGTPWIDAAILALVLIAIVGGGLLGGRERALVRTLDEAGDGAISPALRARLSDPFVLVGNVTIPFFVIAIMWIMIAKPSGPVCAAILVAGALAGAVLGMVMLAGKAPAQAAASEAQSVSS